MGKVGRPRKIESPDQMVELAEIYLEEIDQRNEMRVEGAPWEKPTLNGLILSLGLSSRESFDEYGRREEFSDTVKRLKLIIANEYEKNLQYGNAAGSIFALKNMGWSDKQETVLTGGETPIGVKDISGMSATEKAARLAVMLREGMKKAKEDA